MNQNKTANMKKKSIPLILLLLAGITIPHDCDFSAMA